jgi:hypothetical protein
MNTANSPTGAPAAANRVSISAVLAAEGEDVTEALARAGIVDPVAIPVQAEPEEGFLGDGVTPNLTGVLEAHEADGPGAGSGPPPAAAQPARPATAMLPPERGLQAFAPVRRRRP